MRDRTGYRRRISRLPRIEIADGVYHVVARGNERQEIFRDSDDRERFLRTLRAVSGRYCLEVLAYCLMTNHYHLLAQTPNANLAQGMRQLNGVYAQAFNRRHGRDGHLFQGRYGARLVQRDEHLLATVRYIVRNPLRAGICERPEEWPWSSHAATIGSVPASVLARERLLEYLGDSETEAQAHYVALVESEEIPSLPPHPLVTGETDFVAAHLERVRPSPEYPRAALRPTKRPLDELVQSTHDAAAITCAHVEHGYSMRAIATHLGCGIATVHRRIRCQEKVQAEDETWKT